MESDTVGDSNKDTSQQVIDNDIGDFKNEDHIIIMNIEDHESEKQQVTMNTKDEEMECDKYKVDQNTKEGGSDGDQIKKNMEDLEYQITKNTEYQELEGQLLKKNPGKQESMEDLVPKRNVEDEESGDYEVIRNIEDQGNEENDLNTKFSGEEDEPRLVMECESDGSPDVDEYENDKGILVYDSTNPQTPNDDGKSFILDTDNEIELKKPEEDVADKKTKKRSRRSSKPANSSESKKVYRCNRCVFESTHYSDYVLHDCKPTKGKSFTVTYHSDGNIYSCSCGHIYHKLKTFHEHLVTHMIPKPYRCSLCKDMFSTRKEIMKHLTVDHPNEKMRFYVNGLKFTQIIMEKARAYGSYTQCFVEKKNKSPDNLDNKETKSIVQPSLNLPNIPSTLTSVTLSPSTGEDIIPSTNKSFNSSTSEAPVQSTSKISSPSNTGTSSLSTTMISSPLTSQMPNPTTTQTHSPSTSQIPNPTTIQTHSPSTSQMPNPTTTQTHSPSTSHMPNPTTIQTHSPSTSQMPNPTTIQTHSPSTSQMPNPKKIRPLDSKSVSPLASKNLATSANKQIIEYVKKISTVQSTLQPTTSVSQSPHIPEVIVIDDDDDDEETSAKLSTSQLVIPNDENLHPVGLFKNVCHPDLFQFHFSSSGVKYSCTSCKKDWLSRSHFCFHIWNHQHKNEQKCSKCDQKTGESGVSCMRTIRLFRKLAFASFTNIKQIAEKNGGLKDLSLHQVEFCYTNNIKSYRCSVCSLNLPLLSNLKWHVWQHSHSSIICPACSIMGSTGTRYIICPLVEKLVSKIRTNEEQYYRLKRGMAHLDIQAVDSATLQSTGQKKSVLTFGTMRKKNETLFVCYLCSKQWADKQTFWLHAWTHCHKDRQLCPKCKKSDGFPGMTCSMVDKEINIPELLTIKQDPEVEDFTRLEEDMIITSNEPDKRRPQEDHDIIIIDDTPGPGEAVVKIDAVDVDKEPEAPLKDSSASFSPSYSKLSADLNLTESTSELSFEDEEDEAEVVIDKADVTISDVSFSAPSSSGSNATMTSVSAKDSSSPTLVLRSEHDLFQNCDFPRGLRRNILTEPSVSRAISRFFCVHKNEFLCLICKSTSFALDELIHLYEHIVVQHMKIPLVQCGYCDFNANKEVKIKSHSLSKHPGEVVKVIKYQIDMSVSVDEYANLISFHRSKSLPAKYSEAKFLSLELDALKKTKYPSSDSNVSETAVKNENSKPIDVKFEVECYEGEHEKSEDMRKDSFPIILSTYSLASEGKVVEPAVEKIKPETEMFSQNNHNYFTPNFYACGLCTYSTLIMEDLRKHLFTKHSSEKNIPCKHCGFIGIRTDQLMKHFVNHTSNNSLNIPVFQCIESNCEYRCNNLKGFLSHLETHNLKEYECHECAETMGSLKELGQHLQQNLLFIFSCPHCSAVATNKEIMKGHIENYHDGTIPQEWTNGKQLLCRDRQLYGYVKSKAISAVEAPSTISTIQAVEELNCKLCSFYGVNATDLKSHGEVHSKVQDDSAFICPFCAAPFIEPKQLTDHLMKHAEIQMSVYFFSCKVDNYCTNVYQKILQHIHDGQHVLTGKPEDMFDYKQVTYKSQVICCPRCPFKSACRGYLTCHIEEAHNGNIATDELKGNRIGQSLHKEVASVATNKVTCSEENCTFSTTDSQELLQHIKSHLSEFIVPESTQTTSDTPFLDINTLKRNNHIYIPTDGPDDQENFHLLETRLKAVYAVVAKDIYSCKICKIERPELDQILKHLLLKHLGLQYCCNMCQFSSPLIWRMVKHGKTFHNCRNFNIIYSDKIEEVIKELLDKKTKPVKHKPKSDKCSPETNLALSELRKRGGREKETIRSIIPSGILETRKRGTETCQNSVAEAKKAKIDKNTKTCTKDSSDAISIPKPMDTQQLSPTEADNSSLQWSTSAADKNMCLLGSEYLDLSLSVLYKTEGNRHQCLVCSDWFPAVTRYWIHHHLNLNHLKLSLYKCGYCELTEIEKFKIHQHISKHHPKDDMKVQELDINVNHAVVQYIKKNKLGLKFPNTKEQVEDTASSASISSNNADTYYRCEHCQETFAYIIKAKLHSHTLHKDLQPQIKVFYNRPSRSTNYQAVNSMKRKSSEEPNMPDSKKPNKKVEHLYKCPQCTFCTDVDLDAMLNHFKSHNYEKIVECSTCGVRSFDDKSSKKHHRLRHPEQPEKSNLLPVLNFFKVIKSEDAPTSSLACYSINKQFKFKCKFCNLKSDVDDVMRDHLLQHLDKLKPLIVCSVCSIPIPDVASRKHHFQNVHATEENSANHNKLCKALNDVLLDCLEEGTLKDEPVSTKNFLCLKCPQQFQTLSSASIHYKSFHRLACNMNTYWKDRITGCVFNFHGMMCKNSPKMVDLTKFDVFLCSACSFRANSRTILYDHQKAVHPCKRTHRTLELRYPQDDSTPSTSSGPKHLSFRCLVCPVVSNSLSEYAEHLSCHGQTFKKLKQTDTKGFRCRICTFVSDSEARLNNHVKSHLTLKQYVCAYCSFEANQSTVVKLHVKSAHPNKPMSSSIIDLKSPRFGNCVNFSAKVHVKNFFEMSPHEFENLLNIAHVQDVDLSRVPLEIAEKLLLAY